MERSLLAWLVEAAPPQTRLVLVMDRGYARVALIRELNTMHQPCILRAKAGVVVLAHVGGKPVRFSLGRLRQRSGVALSYSQVLYYGTQQAPADVIVCPGPGFHAPWFPAAPPDSEFWLRPSGW